MATTAGRRPRDAQRRRVYLAETPLPSSPLPGLDACARFVDRVVGIALVARAVSRARSRPRAAPPARQRRASGLLPRRGRPAPRSRCRAGTAPRPSCCTSSRTGRSASTPASPITAARSPACCSTRSASSAVPTTPRCSRRRTGARACTSARPPRRGPDGRLHYGWDERLRREQGCDRARAHQLEHRRRGARAARLLRRLRARVVGAALLGVRRPDSCASRPSAVWAVRDVC